MYILARHDKPENWHRTARQLATYPTDSAQQAVPPEGDNGDPDDRHNNDDKPRQPVRALAHRELFITAIPHRNLRDRVVGGVLLPE